MEVRAPLRAQLLEEGWATVATDTWDNAEVLLLELGLPRVLVVILDDEACAPSALDRMTACVPATRTLVLSRRSLVPRETLAARRFAAILERPFSIRNVVDQVRALAA